MLRLAIFLWIGLTGLTGLASAADAPPVWAGIWAAEPEWCVFADRIGSHSPAPVRLTTRHFEGYENTCEIGQVDRIGTTPVWQLQLLCQSEGSTYDEAMLVIMEGRDVMWQIYQGLEPIRFLRCGS